MDKVTIPSLQQKKRNARKITALTAYDAPFAKLIDCAGIDIVLVGDTVGMVLQGEPHTLSVTMDQMLYHTRIVSRVTGHALVVGDMPFLSYQVSLEETVFNAGRFLKEAGAEAVKLEGGARVADRIAHLTRYDIPVMAHIGLTPQSVHRMGGYKVQGRENPERILEDAQQVEAAGAFAIVLEGMPAALAARITASVHIPTLGIGAGPHCDGQILVLHDLLGLSPSFHPRFVRQYADLSAMASKAFQQFKADVESGNFPNDSEGYGEDPGPR